MNIKRVTMSVYVLECEVDVAIAAFKDCFYNTMPPAYREGEPKVDDGEDPVRMQSARDFLLGEDHTQ